MNTLSLRDLLCAGPHPETLNAIDDGRAPSELLPLLDRELERIRSRLQLLQAYRDDHVLINKLPVEVLVHIFLVYAEDSDQIFDLRWTKLMLVCKRWRDIGEQTPKLWSFIEIAPVVTRLEAHDARRINAQLLRAGTSELTVRMRLDHSLPVAMKTYLPMLEARSNALRCLDLIGDHAQIIKVVDALLRAQLTAVVDLTIHLQLRNGWGDQKVASNEISALLFEKDLSETLPHLRHLSTSGMCVNWGRAATYELRTLDIDLSTVELTASSSFAFSDITDALSRCPLIAHLSLSFPPTFRPVIPLNFANLNIADLDIAISFPHMSSVFMEGVSELCVGILLSLKDVPPIARIAVTASDPIEDQRSEPVVALISYMQRHALKVGAPAIRALALSSIPLGPRRRERPYELRIAGQLHSDREPAAWSKASPPGALVAICLSSKMGPLNALHVVAHALESWPLKQATVIDLHQHMIGIPGVDFWRAAFPHLPAIRTVIVPFGPCGIENTFIEYLRAVPRERVQGVVTHIIFDGDWDGFNPDDARLRVTLMRALLYCADAARAGTPSDTVEVTHGYGSETSPAGTSLSGGDMFDYDCDWSELYRDLREGFIYQGVLHNATVES